MSGSGSIRMITASLPKNQKETETGATVARGQDVDVSWVQKEMQLQRDHRGSQTLALTIGEEQRLVAEGI